MAGHKLDRRILLSSRLRCFVVRCGGPLADATGAWRWHGGPALDLQDATGIASGITCIILLAFSAKFESNLGNNIGLSVDSLSGSGSLLHQVPIRCRCGSHHSGYRYAMCLALCGWPTERERALCNLKQLSPFSPLNGF